MTRLQGTFTTLRRELAPMEWAEIVDLVSNYARAQGLRRAARPGSSPRTPGTGAMHPEPHALSCWITPLAGGHMDDDTTPEPAPTDTQQTALLHKRIQDGIAGQGPRSNWRPTYACGYCSTEDMRVPWPCPTAQALEENRA